MNAWSSWTRIAIRKVGAIQSSVATGPRPAQVPRRLVVTAIAPTSPATLAKQSAKAIAIRLSRAEVQIRSPTGLARSAVSDGPRRDWPGIRAAALAALDWAA